MFNVLVGLMLTAAFLSFGTGAVLWAARLGTYPTYRDEGIRYMMWGVVILFVLVSCSPSCSSSRIMWLPRRSCSVSSCSLSSVG